MYGFIKKRQYGLIRPIRLERAETTKRVYDLELSRTKEFALSHRGGVTCIRIDNSEQRYLLSGGGDGKVHIYDLDSMTEKNEPIASAARMDQHKYAVTSLSWYPADNGLFVTSSYDSTIKVWDTNEMKVTFNLKIRGREKVINDKKAVEEFNMECRVHCQAMSGIASHSLVASAAAEPRIRLCDLANGSFTHSLTGHAGSVMSCVWSTNQEYILYSGGSDGTIRVWDIRKASSCLMSLDQNNAVDQNPLGETNSAHGRGINGLTVTNDGRFLVSLGLDEKIRLWNTQSGHNTFVNYGSSWRNRFKLCLQPALSSPDVWPPLLYIPSDDRQVLVYRLTDGMLVKRLKGAYGRVTSVENRESHQQLYSGSNAGDLLVWEPPAMIAAVEEREVCNMES
ncbi:excision repair cross-complementing rodent repair deficiency, complementation group 8, partial [Rhizopus microsporus ATCC 52813]